MKSLAEPTRPTVQPQRTVVTFGSDASYPLVLRATSTVLLLEGELPGSPTLPVGTPLRVGIPGTTQLVEGRLAARENDGRFLVSLGSRAVRGAARVKVDLGATTWSASLGTKAARLVDLSSSGARLSGILLPIGSELEVTFIPPGRHDSARMRCLVVRAMHADGQREIGVTFSDSSLSFRVELSRRRMAAAATD